MRLQIIILLVLNNLFSWGQNTVDLTVNPYYSSLVKSTYENHPLLKEHINSDSSQIYMTVYTKNCKDDFLVADSIKFSFVRNNKSTKHTEITIIPDSITSFSSHIFAYSLYEGCEILKQPKNRYKPLFIVGETDVIDSLLFLNQQTDKKGQIWYYVEFTYTRHIEYIIEENTKKEVPRIETKRITGWIKRGRTRLGFLNFGCYTIN